MPRRPARKISLRERMKGRERIAKRELDSFIDPRTYGDFTYIFLGTEKSRKAAEKRCKKEGYILECETRMTPQILQQVYRFKEYSAFGKLRTKLFTK